MAEFRVLLDGTPLLGQRTGIGRYTASLTKELASMADVRLIGFTTKGWRQLRSVAPEGIRATGVPVPARALRACWSRLPFPPVELFGAAADVVHGTNFVQPPSMRAPGVLTVHDLAFLDDPDGRSELRSLVRQGARRAAVICTPTQSVADSVSERLGVPRSKIVVTPLGVDREWFDAAPPDAELRRRYQLPADYLIFAGAEGPRKGLAGLRQALGPDMPPLVITGPGDIGWSDGVVRTGYLPDQKLRRVIAGARTLVLPSRDEGFGLPVLEAMACGVPVACSDVPALREVAAGHGFLFTFGETDSIRAAVRRALASTEDTAARARKAHAAEFTWHRCATATLEAYHRARS